MAQQVETSKAPNRSKRLTYTVDEIADLLGISRSMAYECVKRGEIPARRFGRRVLILRAEFDRLVLASDFPPAETAATAGS